MRSISGSPSQPGQGQVRTAVAWLRTPSGSLAILILAASLVRLGFAASLGLGIDESYMVAAGRKLQLSYFDHPPLAWWMAWGIAHLTGNESPIVVRLPFIALFGLTTFLMHRVTAALFDPEAGLWAAVVLNMAPVLGITAGTWVLPDGPLLAALLATLLCLIRALRSEGRAAWGWWSATGGCAGLALCSKYSAALTLAGIVAFLASEPQSRRWLARPHPYGAGLIALVVFLPVVIWNAGHGWISFAFQGGRAGGSLHPFGPFLAIAGQAAFLLPWIWAPLVWCGVMTLRRGPADRERWLLVCLAAPPIVLFSLAAVRGNTLFHWAAPGYLMLLPLLGEAIARRRQTGRLVRIWLMGTAAFVLLGVSLVASAVHYDWLPNVIGNALGRDPGIDLVDWTSLRSELQARGLLDRPGLVVAAGKWHEAGKIDYALGGRVPVICLGADPRQYSLAANPDDYAGGDVLIVAPPHRSLAQIVDQFGSRFDAIEPLASATVLHAGRPAMELPLFIGHRLHKSAVPDLTGDPRNTP